MAQIHTTQLETQRNSSAHPDQIEGSVHETASTAIKAAALSFGADVVGIANIERWEAYAPAGYRPTDLLPVHGLLWSWVHAGRPQVPGAQPILD